MCKNLIEVHHVQDSLTSYYLSNTRLNSNMPWSQHNKLNVLLIEGDLWQCNFHHPLWLTGWSHHNKTTKRVKNAPWSRWVCVLSHQPVPSDHCGSIFEPNLRCGATLDTWTAGAHCLNLEVQTNYHSHEHRGVCWGGDRPMSGGGRRDDAVFGPLMRAPGRLAHSTTGLVAEQQHRAARGEQAAAEEEEGGCARLHHLQQVLCAPGATHTHTQARRVLSWRLCF